jgi:hypothetical protein
MKLVRHLVLLLLAMAFVAGGYVLGGSAELLFWAMAGGSVLLALE